FGDAGLAALAGSPGLPRLSTLDVSDNRIGPGGVAGLAASPLVARLETLVLRRNPVGPDGARALAASEPLSERGRLTALDLGACGIGDVGVASIAAAPWAARLQRLNDYSASTWAGTALGRRAPRPCCARRSCPG